jgi:hypothetical protein
MREPEWNVDKSELTRRDKLVGVGLRAAICCALIFAGASLLPACGLILGLDEFVAPVDDASADAPSTATVEERLEDTFVDDDAEGAISEGSTAPSQGPDKNGASTRPTPVTDSGHVIPPETDASCTPDPSWCDTHCGSGSDNCGVMRQCPTNCPQGYECDNNATCKCKTEISWCTGRCGPTKDNCGNPIDCSSCTDSGPPPCNAQTDQEACAGRECGQATNNCGQLVNCGFLGLSLCPSLLQVCLPDGGCCSPNSARACGNQCGSFVTDNCGRTIQCPTSCGPDGICRQNVCCTRRDPCAGACDITVMDNCGETVQCACSRTQECVAQTCCTPDGCGSTDCVDSCGVYASSCCGDAGPDGSSSGPTAPRRRSGQ